MAEKIYTAACLAAEMGNPNADVLEMRNYLESKGIDRHSRIELRSYDALVITLDGVIYGYRRVNEQKDGDKELSLFGGTLTGDWKDKEAANEIAKNFMAKTPVSGLVPEQIQVIRGNMNWNGEFEYDNGDKTYFVRYGAIIFLNEEQEEELLSGRLHEFHSQILGIAKLNYRSDELWDYQQKIYADILEICGIQQ